MPYFSFNANPLEWTFGFFPITDLQGKVTARRFCFGPYVTTWN